jgi:hypothetical protein
VPAACLKAGAGADPRLPAEPQGSSSVSLGALASKHFDEGREYRGIDRIRAWRDEVHRKYTFSTDPREVVERGDETILIATLEGDFPGSPVELAHEFRFHVDRIVALAIHP